MSTADDTEERSGPAQVQDPARTWWVNRPGEGALDLDRPDLADPRRPVADTTESIADLIDLAADDVHERLRRASAMARSIVRDARRESATILDQARVSADQTIAAARSQAAHELEQAQKRAEFILHSAQQSVAQQSVAQQSVDEAQRLATVSPQTVSPRTVSPPADAPHQALNSGPTAAPPVEGPQPSLDAPAAPPPPERRHRATRERGWGGQVYRARKAIVVMTVLLAAASAAWGIGVISSLSNGGFSVIGSQSEQAQDRVEATVGRQGFDVIALYTSEDGTVDDPGFRSAVQAAYDRIPSEDVIAKASYWSTAQAPQFVSTDRRSTYLAVRLAGDEDRRLATYAGLQTSLRIDPAVATTLLGGTTGVDDQINLQVGEDLTRAETISAPVLAVLLVLVFGSAVAAGLPLLIGGLTVVVSFVVLRLLSQVTEVSVFALNIVTVLGLGLAIDYALLIVSRFREEQRAGRDTGDALARTMATAGRSVAFSSITVAGSLAGLLLFPVGFLRSMAYGGVAAVLIAATASLVVLPALIGVLGHRVNSWRIPLPRLRLRSETNEPSGTPRWERLAHSVMRRPVLYLVGVSVVLLTLAYPVLHVEFGGVDSRQLPASAQGRVVDERLSADFTGIQLSPIDVVVDTAAAAAGNAADRVGDDIQALDGVRGVREVATEGGTTLLAVDYAGRATDQGALDLVERIRTVEPPSGAEMLVGGASASQVDLRDSIADGLWKMALLTVGITFLLLFWAFGSFVLPLKAILMNALSVAAALGVVVLVFQDGWLSWALGFTSTGFVELTQPILVLAILFGVSTDYEVFLLSRIREHWDASGDNRESVAKGLQQTGPIITSAALLILVVIAAFSTSEIIFIKLIGVGMFVAILLDATVVRALLVPATMRLMGRWNWWAPGPILRFWNRHRPTID